MGYDSSRFEIIPNGFDLGQYKPDAAARAEVRKELSIEPDAPLIGMVARFDPQKDHRSFVAAAGALHARRPDVRFVLVGKDCDAQNAGLGRWIAEQPGLGNVMRLLGRRGDVARLTAAFDLATSTSAYGEAFPNVLGEAMACAVPCVATDVGESAHIIGDTGRIVERDRPEKIAAAPGRTCCPCRSATGCSSAPGRAARRGAIRD